MTSSLSWACVIAITSLVVTAPAICRPICCSRMAPIPIHLLIHAVAERSAGHCPNRSANYGAGAGVVRSVPNWQPRPDRR